MISVIIALYNDEKYIRDAVSSIINQTYTNFELIIINDCSTDNSLNIVKEFKDKRIRIHSNKKNLGISESRNYGIKLSRGEYIFFTDSDCIADKNWLRSGLKTFKNHDCLGIDGKTYYVKKGYKKTFSDKMPGNVDTEESYMNCNMAFKKDAFKKAGLFDRRYEYHEDLEFVLRLLRYGNIVRDNNMIIVHQKKLWNVKGYIKSGRRAANRIVLFKNYGEKSFIWHRILFPKNLV